MAKSKTSGIYFKVTDEERSLIEQRMALMGRSQHERLYSEDVY